MVGLCISASSLLHQWGSTRWSQDVSAGRSLIGALGRSALWPVGTSWATGPRRTHAGSRTASDRGDGPVGPKGAPAALRPPTHGWWTSEPPVLTAALLAHTTGLGEIG